MFCLDFLCLKIWVNRCSFCFQFFVLFGFFCLRISVRCSSCFHLCVCLCVFCFALCFSFCYTCVCLFLFGYYELIRCIFCSYWVEYNFYLIEFNLSNFNVPTINIVDEKWTHQLSSHKFTKLSPYFIYFVLSYELMECVKLKTKTIIIILNYFNLLITIIFLKILFLSHNILHFLFKSCYFCFFCFFYRSKNPNL